MRGIPAGEIGVPPSHLANIGGGWNGESFFVNGNVTYQDSAIWRDVLDARYWGPTESFTSVGALIGYRFSENITLSVTGTNLLDERIQQHVFGDIISRRLTAKLHFQY